MKYTSQEVFAFFKNLKTPSTNERFFEIEIFRYSHFELKDVEVNSLDPGYTDNERLETYASLNSEPPPILLDHRMRILDGFHRVKAQKKKNKEFIQAFVPIGEPLY